MRRPVQGLSGEGRASSARVFTACSAPRQPGGTARSETTHAATCADPCKDSPAKGERPPRESSLAACRAPRHHVGTTRPSRTRRNSWSLNKAYKLVTFETTNDQLSTKIKLQSLQRDSLRVQRPAARKGKTSRVREKGPHLGKIMISKKRISTTCN